MVFINKYIIYVETHFDGEDGENKAKVSSSMITYALTAIAAVLFM